jgi:hypothetical protein
VTSLKIQNGGGPHPKNPILPTLERSSKYHVLSIAKKTLLVQYTV